MPAKDPKFHHKEIFIGVGRSIKELLIILINGCLLKSWICDVIKFLFVKVLDKN